MLFCFVGDDFCYGIFYVDLKIYEFMLFVEFTLFCCWGLFQKIGIFFVYQDTLDAFTIILSLKVGNLADASGKSSHAMLF